MEITTNSVVESALADGNGINFVTVNNVLASNEFVNLPNNGTNTTYVLASTPEGLILVEASQLGLYNSNGAIYEGITLDDTRIITTEVQSETIGGEKSFELQRGENNLETTIEMVANNQLHSNYTFSTLINVEPPDGIDSQGKDPVTANTLPVEVEITETPAVAPSKPPPIPPDEDEIMPPHRKGPFRCPVCGITFTKYISYRRHHNTHVDEKPHRCSKCPAAYNVKSNLVLHMAMHVTDSPQCPECNKKFTRIASLKAHLMLHEKEENVFCKECGEEFLTQYSLDIHSQEHRKVPSRRVVKTEPLKYLQCQKCYKHFTKPALFKEHMNYHLRVRMSLKHRPYRKHHKNDEMPNKCEVCSKGFRKPSQLVRHVRIHTGERPYKCDKCSKAFNQKGALQIHLSKHFGLRPYPCDFCASTFSQKGNLRSHIKRVHNLSKSVQPKDAYHCESCSCVFRKLGSLNSHLSRMHRLGNNLPLKPYPENNKNDGEATTNPLNPELSLDTEHPASNFDSEPAEIPQNTPDILKQALENSGVPHESNHPAAAAPSTKTPFPKPTLPTGDGSVIVPVTDNATGRITNHKMRMVGNTRWHQCQFCNKEFKKPSDLIRHIRCHTHEKPFRCRICFRSFSVKSSRNAHLLTHSGEKRFPCTVCCKLFSTKGSHGIHMRLHTGDKPFPCNKCGKKFRTSGHRQSHMLWHLKELSQEAKSKKQNTSDQTEGQLSVRLQEPILITENQEQSTTALDKDPLNAQAATSTSETSSEFKCPTCSKVFKSLGSFKQHEKVHGAFKSFECSQCEFSSTSASALRSHQLIHSTSKDYVCTQCNTAFIKKSYLKRHEITHSHQRPFLCAYCQKTFKTRISCKTHMKIHAQELTQNPTEIIANDENQTENVTLIAAGNPQMITLNGSGVMGTLENVTETTTFDQTSAYETEPATTILEDQTGLTQILNISNQPGEYTLQENLDPSFSGELINDGITNISNILNSEPEMEVVPPGESMLASRRKKSNYICEVCHKVFKKSSQLKQHLMTHSGDRPFHCGVCGRLFTTKGVLKIHMNIHTGQKEFKCSTCNSSFTTKGSLKRHQIVHESTNQQSCSECLMSFRNAGALKRHMYLHHKQDSNNLEAEENVEKNRRVRQPIVKFTDEEAAELAQKYTEDNSSLSMRVLLASAAEKGRVSEIQDEIEALNDRPIHPNKCPQCPKSFKKPSDLERHIRIHTGEKPYSCSLCKKAFTVKSTLDFHMNTHYGHKNFHCHVCNTMFATKGSLKVHMRLHTGSKPYKCSHCDQKFRTSGHRKSHMANHFKSPKTMGPKTTYVITEQSDSTQSTFGAQETEELQMLRQVVQQEDHLLNQDNQISQLISHQTHLLSTPESRQEGTNPSSISTFQFQLHSQFTNGQSLQITGLDPNYLGNQPITIDAALLQQLQQTGNINITIMPDSETSLLQIQPTSLEEELNQGGTLVSEEVTVMPTIDLPPETTSPKSLPCSYCEESFATTNTLNCHLLTHLEQATQAKGHSHNCTYCDKSFSKPSQLQRHVRIHTGEKPFKCNHCDKSFNQKNALQTHQNKHTGERPFTCPHCDMAFTQKGNLTCHTKKCKFRPNINND